MITTKSKNAEKPVGKYAHVTISDQNGIHYYAAFSQWNYDGLLEVCSSSDLNVRRHATLFTLAQLPQQLAIMLMHLLTFIVYSVMWSNWKHMASLILLFHCFAHPSTRLNKAAIINQTRTQQITSTTNLQKYVRVHINNKPEWNIPFISTWSIPILNIFSGLTRFINELFHYWSC